MFGWLKRTQPRATEFRIPEFARDWAAGDGAKCIASNGAWMDLFRHPQPGPVPGQILKVRDVVCFQGAPWLNFHGWPEFAYPAGHFRKLRPCSADFREQIRNRQPVPVRNLELVR
jgi:hypothetical protein